MASRRVRDGPYILTDRRGRYLWCGPGLRPLGYLAGHVQRIPMWDTLEQAKAVAAALKRGIGVQLVPKLIKIGR